MRNNFDDLVRERCKDLLLAGHLARVIATHQFMGHTDQQFGEFLAPLIQTEPLTETPQEVTSENTPQETPVPNIRKKLRARTHRKKHLYRTSVQVLCI